VSDNPDRQALYDEIRQRFIEDPDFRIKLRADPVATLQEILGELTKEERTFAAGLTLGSTSDFNLVEQLKRRPPGAW
jgi:hypothetical protein